MAPVLTDSFGQGQGEGTHEAQIRICCFQATAQAKLSHFSVLPIEPVALSHQENERKGAQLDSGYMLT